jgi:hypothetical protein
MVMKETHSWQLFLKQIFFQGTRGSFLKQGSQNIFPICLKIVSALPSGMDKPDGGVLPTTAMNSPSSILRLQVSHSKGGFVPLFTLSLRPIFSIKNIE